MNKWHSPEEIPDVVGEYKCALEPHQANTNMRRFWHGNHWSSPYSIAGSEELQQRAKNEFSPFLAYWMEDTGESNR